MGSKACRLFVLTVKELLSQNEGSVFLPTACRLRSRTHMQLNLCVFLEETGSCPASQSV